MTTKGFWKLLHLDAKLGLLCHLKKGGESPPFLPPLLVVGVGERGQLQAQKLFCVFLKFRLRSSCIDYNVLDYVYFGF